MRNVRKKLKILVRRIVNTFGKIKLVTVYAWTCVIAIVLFICSWYFSNKIAGESIRNEYEEYNEALFEQTISDINRGLFDLVQLSYTIMSSDSNSRSRSGNV